MVASVPPNRDQFAEQEGFRKIIVFHLHHMACPAQINRFFIASTFLLYWELWYSWLSFSSGHWEWYRSKAHANVQGCVNDTGFSSINKGKEHDDFVDSYFCVFHTVSVIPDTFVQSTEGFVYLNQFLSVSFLNFV